MDSRFKSIKWGAEKDVKNYADLISDIVEMIENMKNKNQGGFKDTIDNLSAQKAFLLTEHDFELDYMDVRYRCPKCKDTGMLETGERCPCHREITPQMIKELQKTE